MVNWNFSFFFQIGNYNVEPGIFFCQHRATGYSTMKIGKTAAFLIGSSIILLEVAHEQGLIKIDWSKVSKKVDQVGDKVEEVVTGEGPKWMDKVSNQNTNKWEFVDHFFLWFSSLVFAGKRCFT